MIYPRYYKDGQNLYKTLPSG